MLPTEKAYTVMDFAAGMESSDFLRVALKYKPDLNQRSPRDGRTPLGRSIITNRRENLHVLIDAGCDLNFEDGWGETPMVTASVATRYDFVLEMLRAGADGAKITSFNRSLPISIGGRYLDPNSEQYEWRERVIRFLKTKNIEAHSPLDESRRTKPLPQDLRKP